MMKIKKKSIALLLVTVFILSSCYIGLQSVFAIAPHEFSGNVKDDATNTNLQGVLVTLKMGGLTQDTDYTDSSGNYEVETDPLFNGGWASLIFTKSKYDPITECKWASPGGDSTVNVKLDPQGVSYHGYATLGGEPFPSAIIVRLITWIGEGPSFTQWGYDFTNTETGYYFIHNALFDSGEGPYYLLFWGLQWIVYPVVGSLIAKNLPA